MFWRNIFLEVTEKLNQLKMLHALRQECGSIFIFTAVVLPIMLGLTGIAFDVGNLYMHKARLQNVADAAALAGARAFADSQANDGITKMRDKVDQKITVTSYKPSVSYSINDSESERHKNHGTDTSPHPNADEEADKYIYNNLINLGNNISTDLYSHYALLSKEYNPRTFYRVGLVEEVNLYFLPIIRGIGKTQPVGVEAIVLLSEDKGQEIPATVFSNLFTYTGNLHVKNSNVNNKIQTVFDGQMFYTGDSNDTTNYFTIDDSLKNLYSTTDKSTTNNPGIHSTAINLNEYMPFFNEKLQRAKDLNACVELDVSQATDRNLFTCNNINNLNSNLYKKHETDEYGNLMYTIKYPDDFGITKEFTFSIDRTIDDVENDQRYYTIDDQKNIMYCYKVVLSDGTVLRVPAYKYGNDETSFTGGFPYTDSSNRVFEGYYAVDGSKDRLYFSIDSQNVKDGFYGVYFTTKDKMQVLDAYYRTTNPGTNGIPTKPNFCMYNVGSKKCGTHFKYSTTNTKNENYRLINFMAFKNENFTPNPKARTLTLNANVFHLINTDSTYNQPTNLTIDRTITGHGNISEPIYIFDHTGNTLNITVNDRVKSGRPIVIIYDNQAAGQVNVNAKTNTKFDCTIYAPKSLVHTDIWSKSVFEGNIVARDIESVGNAKSGTTSFVQKNHLESDTELYRDIIQHAQNNDNGQVQLFGNATDLSKPPSNTYNSSWKNWYNFVEAETPGAAKTWFDSLNRNQQIAFWRSWDAAERPQNAQQYSEWENQGLYAQWYDGNGTGSPGWKEKWFFSEWANSDNGPQPEEILAAKNNVSIEHVFDTKVRLINPRLEANPFNT